MHVANPSMPLTCRPAPGHHGSPTHLPSRPAPVARLHAVGNGVAPALHAQSHAPVGADSVHLTCPHTTALFLQGLARDHGPDMPKASAMQQVQQHARLIEKVHGFIATRSEPGEPARCALQRRLETRAPGQSTVEVFQRFAAPRTQRDFDRSTCRLDARAAGAQGDDFTAVPRTGTEAPARTVAAGLRVRNLAQAATVTLLIASQVAVARSQQIDSARPFLPIPSGHGATRPATSGIVRALAAGSTLAVLGTCAWAGLRAAQPKEDPEAADMDAGAGAATAPAVSLGEAALDYLALHNGIDGENLLETLLWRLTGSGSSTEGWRAELLRSMAPQQAQALASFIDQPSWRLDDTSAAMQSSLDRKSVV